MNIIILTHPSFFPSQSMPRFASMIAQGMQQLGHKVEIWTPEPLFFKLPFPAGLKKWLGYIDQYIIFPFHIWIKTFVLPKNSIFVISDQALGIWVPRVKHLPHVVHCHDFLAFKSSKGLYEQNRVSFSGRLYQYLIKRGFSQADNYISVSNKTQLDLHEILIKKPANSVVVYNGLNYRYSPLPFELAYSPLVNAGITQPNKGFLLHVGGNQWYKNRMGVLEIYAAYTNLIDNPLPLYMIGQQPSKQLLNYANEALSGLVKFLVGVETLVIHAAYSHASALIFPSISEGFGWPIAEAMACGCPVLTTDDSPMNEVGGVAAKYIPVKDSNNADSWALLAAKKLLELLNEPNNEKIERLQAGLEQVGQFDTDKAIASYEAVYLKILQECDK